MPSGNKDSIGDLVNIFTSLNKIKDEPRGVSTHPSIVKDTTDKVKPNLESTEVSRLKNIADVLGKAWKLGDYTPRPEAGKLDDLTPDKQKSLGVRAINDKIAPLQQKSDSLPGMLSSLLGLLGLGNIKTLARKLFDTFKTKLGDFFKSIGRSLWSSVKLITNKLWSAIKWSGNKIWAGIKFLGSKLSNWAGKIVDKIKGSKFYTGFMEKVVTVKDGLKTLWDDVIKSIKGFVDDIISGILKVKDAAFKALEKIPGYNLVKKGVDATVEKAAKGTGVVVRATGRLIRAAKAEIKPVVSKLFRGGSGKLGAFFKGIPLIAPIIESLFAANDIQKLKQEYQNKTISLDDLRLKAGMRAVEAITGVGGAALGGAALSFIPGIGTLIGSIGGAEVGKYLGELLVNNLLSPNITKKMGSYITNTQELQDFIVKGNKVYPFNSKDELLSMKTGGAIDNLINSKTENIAPDSVVEYNKFAKTALIEQIKRQDTMIDLLVQLIRKPGSNTVINNTGGSNISPNNFRDNFTSLTLVTN